MSTRLSETIHEASAAVATAYSCYERLMRRSETGQLTDEEMGQKVEECQMLAEVAHSLSEKAGKASVATGEAGAKLQQSAERAKAGAEGLLKQLAGVQGQGSTSLLACGPSFPLGEESAANSDDEFFEDVPKAPREEPVRRLSRAEEVEEKKESVLRIFRKADINHDGCLSKNEFFLMLGRMGENAQKLFDIVDKDKSGYLDYNEFVCWLFELPDEVPETLKPIVQNGFKDCLAEAFVFSLQDHRVDFTIGDEGHENKELVEAALESVVPGLESKHPQRAEAGRKLLQHARSWLHPSAKQSSMDEAIVQQVFRDSMPSDVTIHSVEQVADPAQLSAFLKKVAEDRSSVEIMFHGTRYNNVASIKANGLSTTHCSRGLYGLGAYIASHAGLAHKYTSASRGGKRHMFSVLCDSGRIAVGGKDKKHVKTTVDRIVNPEQFCFVDPHRIFISHLIEYSITGPGANLESALRAAIKRAALDEQKDGK